ncbi:hypothetical protein [uncultured Flavobacterium sp.]|uniref:hypothetical protein n=1 Tax=uncultured Flavobacterium sp. TaxID=165435 RepID=UPI0030EB4E2B|tara:strand:- start:23270 stop:23764 length:495 start_codon:yes stop_codon:yes gene_type:complete
MGNFTKIVAAFFIAFFLFSFSNSEKTSLKIKSKSSSNAFFAEDTLTWKLLGEIKYSKKTVKDYGEVEFPVVNPKLKALGKKTVVISGFIIPIDSKSFAISKNVFAACFFCGKSGPETLAGIKFRGSLPKLNTDQYVTLKGTFRYNETDIEDWIYHIEDAVIVKK